MSPDDTGTPAFDDSLKAVPEGNAVNEAAGASGFVLTRIQASEKPSLSEALIEPAGTGDPCTCNVVCTCVPDQVCTCNSVCTCDTVSSCPGFCTCIGNCGCNVVIFAPCG